MEQRDNRKPLVQRIVEANVLGDGNLYGVTSTDILVKSFDNYSNDGTTDIKSEEEEKK